MDQEEMQPVKADALVECYALRELWRTACYPMATTTRRPSKTRSICRTLGKQLFTWLRGEMPEASSADLKAAIFGRFLGGVDLLIDPDLCDVTRLTQAWDEEIKRSRVRYVFVFGRLAHDEFSRQCDLRRTLLDHAEIIPILDRLPQGVFQVADLVSGPFGLLRSKAHRMISPEGPGVASYCEDPACRSLHLSKLETGTTDAGSAYGAIYTHLPPRKRWEGDIIGLFHPTTHFYRMDNPGDLVWLVGSGLLEKEMRLVSDLRK